MIQAALNGDYDQGDHELAPVSQDELVADAAANWAVIEAGIAIGRDVRVGLADTIVARDGRPAPGNAAQVRWAAGAVRARDEAQD